MIFNQLATVDEDSNVNGQVEYLIGEKGGDFFEIDLPHQGLLKLKRKLDFETEKTHFVTIIARVSFLARHDVKLWQLLLQQNM